MWPNVGQTGVSGRPPRPHQAGGGAFFIIEETRQYESGDNGGAVLKPLTPHMPPRICRRASCATSSNSATSSSNSAGCLHNPVSRAYSTNLYFVLLSALFYHQLFAIHFTVAMNKKGALKKYKNEPRTYMDSYFTACLAIWFACKRRK